MVSIEDACAKELATDCGVEWVQFLSSVWFRTRWAIQQLVQNVDTSRLDHTQGKEYVFQQFAIPMLSSFFRLCSSHREGPDVELWWQSPFHAWSNYTSQKAGISSDDLIAKLANSRDASPRSIERWMAGEPIGKVDWPYRPTVLEAIGGEIVAKRVGVGEIDKITGWLMLAVAFQSLPPNIRNQIRCDYNARSQDTWSLDKAFRAINRISETTTSARAFAFELPALQNHIERLFHERPNDMVQLTESIAMLKKMIEEEKPQWRSSIRYLHDFYAARLAAINGQEDDALQFYESAVAKVWWSSGQNQHPVINEALLYSVGVGKKSSAAHYWDKTFLLGLNAWPKRKLDEQELRRISFGFEKIFSPLKAKERIPPRTEIILRDEEFSLSPQQLANPNRKAKFAEGRTRRSPLMDAINNGNLDDVRRAVEAGGDLEDYVKESGEGPLSYAMRRACDRKDPTIMDYILSFDLSTETVNRPASTKRETPLKIAIEMANASAVERLIILGADVEHACDYVPSALCYAMTLLHGSIHRDDRTQEQAYLQGKIPADVYDAKDGAVLSADLAARRQAQWAARQASPDNQKIFRAVMEYFIRPVSDHREVIQTLLHQGANANKRYKVEVHDIAEWTPTLFAAQIGDLHVFKMLVTHGGDPDLTLMQSSAFENYDALWVAVSHGRSDIVSYLKMLDQKH
jgi:ankyrin repeat protein